MGNIASLSKVRLRNDLGRFIRALCLKPVMPACTLKSCSFRCHCDDGDSQAFKSFHLVPGWVDWNTCSCYWFATFGCTLHHPGLGDKEVHWVHIVCCWAAPILPGQGSLADVKEPGVMHVCGKDAHFEQRQHQAMDWLYLWQHAGTDSECHAGYKRIQRGPRLPSEDSLIPAQYGEVEPCQAEDLSYHWGSPSSPASPQKKPGALHPSCRQCIAGNMFWILLLHLPCRSVVGVTSSPEQYLQSARAHSSLPQKRWSSKVPIYLQFQDALNSALPAWQLHPLFLVKWRVSDLADLAMSILGSWQVYVLWTKLVQHGHYALQNMLHQVTWWKRSYIHI